MFLRRAGKLEVKARVTIDLDLRVRSAWISAAAGVLGPAARRQRHQAHDQGGQS